MFVWVWVCECIMNINSIKVKLTSFHIIFSQKLLIQDVISFWVKLEDENNSYLTF